LRTNGIVEVEDGYALRPGRQRLDEFGLADRDGFL
jgi:hypothetical protein